MLKGRTPLGWMQLWHNPARFVVASAGVGFAVLLVFIQLGFMNMLFDTTVNLHGKLVGDVAVMNADATGIPDTGTLSRRRLVQATGVPGVADGHGIYYATVNWKKPNDGTDGNLLLIGVPTDVPVFTDPALNARLPELRLTGSVLIDEGARGDFTAFFDSVRRGDQPRVSISGTNATVIGSFVFGSTFATEAIAITSTETFLALNPRRSPGVISLGLLTVAPGYSAEQVAQAVQASTGADIKAMAMPDFITFSRSRMANDSPIAIVFAFGAIVGLFVGAIIVVQILSSDVQDHLGEYATFKAMGFSNGYLLAIVYEQALILTFAGFLPAYALSVGLYHIIGGLVSMSMTMTVERTVTVFLLCAGMCAIAGTIAMRRIFQADPAEVF